MTIKNTIKGNNSNSKISNNKKMKQGNIVSPVCSNSFKPKSRVFDNIPNSAGGVHTTEVISKNSKPIRTDNNKDAVITKPLTNNCGSQEITIQQLKKPNFENLNIELKSQSSGHSISNNPNDLPVQQQQQQQQQQQIFTKVNIPKDVIIKDNRSLSKKKWDETLKKREDINRNFIEYAKMNKVESCLDLISPAMGELKSDVNACFSGDNYWTALHFSCWNGNFKFVNLLIYNEANIDSEAKSCVTP